MATDNEGGLTNPNVSSEADDFGSLRTELSRISTSEESHYKKNVSSSSSTAERLVDQYRSWINTDLDRSSLYEARIGAAWKSLLADINRWEIKLATSLSRNVSDRLIQHHIVQFNQFAVRGYNALINETQDTRLTENNEIVDFEALVVGVFTAQWLLLRDVASQRVAGSPYRSGLHSLDKEAQQYYAKLYYVFNQHLDRSSTSYYKDRIASFAPLVYLGNITQLTIFNRRVPLMISIPFGALSHPEYPDTNQISKATRMALPHEIAHSIFAQIPELIEELVGKLKEEIDADASLSRSKRVIYTMAINWTEEICADLVGTALAGEAFARSARWVMAGSSSLAGVTDESHPPTILRPIIHLIALSCIQENEPDKEYEDVRIARAYLQEEIKHNHAKVNLLPDSPSRLERQFRSVPALMFVQLKTIYDVLVDLVERRLLNTELDVLNKKTLAALLVEISNVPKKRLPDDKFDPWGEIGIAPGEFVLDSPVTAAPTFGTPGVFNRPDCCSISFLRPLCC